MKLKNDTETKQNETETTETTGDLIGIYRKFVCCMLLVGGILFGIQLLCAYIMQEEQTLRVKHLLFDFINLAVLLIVILVLGYHYIRNLREIASGIDALAAGKAVHLKEEGIAAELAAGINKTSDMLEEQRRLIAKRDNTRMEWIRGVSHDIRTPLSMVMGYAEMLEDDEKLGKEQRQRAAIIKEQSLRMRELIEDLNLTSKLEQDCQPLRLSLLSPAELLRDAAAAIINAQSTQLPEADAESDLDELCEGNTEGRAVSGKHDIILLILPVFEKLRLRADQNLLRRVFSNIIGNAVRHNPCGCSIMVLAHCTRTQAIVEILDNGRGIPEDVAQLINALGSELSGEEETARTEEETRQASGHEAKPETKRLDVPHVMGMRIAKQIMLAHGGNLLVLPDRHTVSLVFEKEKYD